MADVLALSRAEFEHSKLHFKRRYYAHGVTLIASVVALPFDNRIAYLLAAITVVAEAVAWAFRAHAQGLFEQANRGNRRSLLIQAFGRQPHDLDGAAIEVDFSSWARKHAGVWADPSYWTTDGPNGPQRLRDSLQESAFYTSSLCRAAAAMAAMRLAAFLVLVFIGLVVLLLLDTDSVGVMAARVVIVLMTILVSSDELDAFRSYRATAEVARRTCERLQHADLADPPAALSLFADYQVATASCPPVPTSIYEKRKNDIARAWAGRAG